MNDLQKNKNISIAVLPFDLNWEEERIENLFRGFAEDLIINLSKYLGLSVISSYSTMRIKRLTDLDEIKQLGADFLVFGTVRKMKDHMRVTIQLIKADHQELIFAGQHDLTLDSLVETQDGVVQQIVSVLQEKIDYSLLSHSYKKESVQLLAYENYLLGMNELKKGSANSDVKSRKFFNQALKINPHYSLAYTGLSLSYFNFWSCILWERWDKNMKGAKKYALKATELDPNDYTALGILGRVYVYQGEFDLAEHCLRKSLRMNGNDASNLLRVSFSLMMLGYAEEAVKLYHRAIELNPFHKDSYHAYGSNYYLQAGDFEQSIALSRKAPIDSWTDFPAWVAAAYLQVQDYKNVWKYWDIYIEFYKRSIYKGSNSIQSDAIEWLKELNPFQSFSYLSPLMDFVRKEKKIENNDFADNEASKKNNSFVLNGEIWELSYKAKQAFLKDAKGYHDLLKLIKEPGKNFHCLDLMGSAIQVGSRTDVIDEKARRNYMNRIKDLQEEIEEAEEFNQLERVSRLQAEYDDLLEHLSGSMGLSGKTRKAGSSLEKARSAVTWRIRSAIKKIGEKHPELGKHLSASIKTGTYCKYNPEQVVEWSL